MGGRAAIGKERSWDKLMAAILRESCSNSPSRPPAGLAGVTTGAAAPVKCHRGAPARLTCEASGPLLASVHTSAASELSMVGFTAMVGLE